MELILNFLTAIGTIGAVIVAMVAISHGNKNSVLQIRVNKLEELYETIQKLSSYYPTYEILHYKISIFREENKTSFDWLAEYYQFRDEILPEADRLLIVSYLARIEVLAQCYTSGELKLGILSFQDLLYWFSDKVFDGSSMNDILVEKKIFPEHAIFIKQVNKLKSGILAEINP